MMQSTPPPSPPIAATTRSSAAAESKPTSRSAACTATSLPGRWEVFDEVSEEKQAREYLRRKRLKKPGDQKQAARIFRALLRAGFGAKTIFGILKKWDVDEEVLTALEGEGEG